MFIPRFVIISITSGGILGIEAIYMVVVIFHGPGLPCGTARAAAGMKMAAAMRVEASLRVM